MSFLEAVAALVIAVTAASVSGVLLRWILSDEDCG